MARRTFGWVQNPGKLSNLKKVVSVFKLNSKYNIWLREVRLPLLKKYNLICDEDYENFQRVLAEKNIVVEYASLKGRGVGNNGRSSAICTGIIQAVIDGQREQTYIAQDGTSINIKKPYTDDWSAEGFLRWAISCGLLNYDRENDNCFLSDIGSLLADTQDSSVEEKDIFTKALLSYPPVCRVLNILSDGKGYTKFELGKQLGFYGELGFTSIPQNIYIYDYNMANISERNKIRSNEEGDSDKYARGIASWCSQMGWVTSKSTNITEEYKDVNYTASYTARLQKYFKTREGEKAIKKSIGNSSNAKIPKIVLYEMLASNKVPDADFLRYKRANIIKAILNAEKTLQQIKNALEGVNIETTESSIVDDIIGLKRIGINIREHDKKYRITDKIKGLKIPTAISISKTDITQLKEKIRENLKTVDHKYLVLVDLAYSDASTKGKKNADAREFEIQTAELFTRELNFSGMRLGDANRPDVIISYEDFGAIIDNKSYKDGFNIDRKCADEMSRYINENTRRVPGIPKNEWWKNFDIKVHTFYFLFITSFLKGNFKSQLDYISKSQSDIQGGAVSVDNLLYIAEKLKSGVIRYEDFFKLFVNEDIIV